jgi:hypothetical protein
MSDKASGLEDIVYLFEREAIQVTHTVLGGSQRAVACAWGGDSTRIR